MNQYYSDMIYEDTYLEHHGVQGQKWGVQNGPPYPLGRDVQSLIKGASGKGELKSLSSAIKANYKANKNNGYSKEQYKSDMKSVQQAKGGMSDTTKKILIAAGVAVAVAGVSYAAYKNKDSIQEAVTKGAGKLSDLGFNVGQKVKSAGETVALKGMYAKDAVSKFKDQDYRDSISDHIKAKAGEIGDNARLNAQTAGKVGKSIAEGAGRAISNSKVSNYARQKVSDVKNSEGYARARDNIKSQTDAAKYNARTAANAVRGTKAYTNAAATAATASVKAKSAYENARYQSKLAGYAAKDAASRYGSQAKSAASNASQKVRQTADEARVRGSLATSAAKNAVKNSSAYNAAQRAGYKVSDTVTNARYQTALAGGVKNVAKSTTKSAASSASQKAKYESEKLRGKYTIKNRYRD